MFKSTKITSAALALAMLAPATAMAETVSIPVRYGDLNLASKEGRAAFDRRIAAASRQICGSADTEKNLTRRSAVKKCNAEVRQSAEPARMAAILAKSPQNS